MWYLIVSSPDFCHLSYFEVEKEYKYLSILFTISGKFSKAVSNLYSRGQKTYFKSDFKLINSYKIHHPKSQQLYMRLIILSNQSYYMLVRYGMLLKQRNSIVFQKAQLSKYSKIFILKNLIYK